MDLNNTWSVEWKKVDEVLFDKSQQRRIMPKIAWHLTDEGRDKIDYFLYFLIPKNVRERVLRETKKKKVLIRANHLFFYFLREEIFS